MDFSRIYLIAITSFLFPLFCAGQTIDQDSNWYKEIGNRDDPYSGFDFTRYTRNDVEKAKAKYLRIAATTTDDELAGTYRWQTMLGSVEITWDRKNGFVYTYVYHTLASLDYGSTVLTGDSVTFVSEKPTVRRGKHFLAGEHVHVKFGERHLLVPKTRLKDFAIWAVGREVPTGQREKEIYSEEGFFWEKVEVGDKKVAEVPTYPDRFAHLVRKPIQSRILTIGKLKIKREKSADWGTTSEDHLVTLRLSAGQRQGVRLGMRFWIDDLEEWVEINSVSANHSLGEMSRPFIDGKEYCSRYDGSRYVEFACRNPKAGMLTRTKVDYF